MPDAIAPYPATLEIEYPDRPLDRVTSFFRPITAIPILVLLGLLTSGAVQLGRDARVAAAGGVVWLPVMLMIVVRRKYPRWWFDWNLELTRFSTRVMAYLALLTDRYPATDAPQGVRIEIPYPDAAALDPLLPLVKWLFAIPHYIALAFITTGAVLAVIAAWCAILLTGRYPRGLFDFVVGTGRWWLRVSAYAFLLTTDRYPPFRLGT